MADLKTRPTGASVTAFMAEIEDRQMRTDAGKVAAMMRRATGKRATMWGPGIVGYGRFDKLMSKLGKYRTGKSCLYTGRLSDVDEDVLERLITASVEYMREHYDTR
jgi:hypothetical protein